MVTRKFLETVVVGVGAFLLSGALQVLFAGGRDTAADGDKRFETILALVYLSVLVIGLIHFRRSAYALLHNPALLALLILAFVSAAWAEFPGVVVRRAMGVAGASLFGVIFGASLSAEEQLRILRWVLRVAAVLSLAMVILSPRHGIAPMLDGGGWRGVFNHKNGLGGAMALAILVEWIVPTHAILSKIAKVISLCLYAVLLAFSDSVTAVIAIAFTFVILYSFRIFRGQYRLPLPALLAGVLTLAGFLYANQGSVTGTLGRSSDITGRTELWHWVFDMIQRHPWLGYGFSGFWRGGSAEYAFVERMIGWSPMYSHNGYLEITLSLGVAGLVLFLWMVLTGFRRALHQAENPASVHDLWPLAFLVFFLIHNLGECTILWQNCLEWSLCIAVVVGSDPRLRAPSEAAAPESDEVTFAPAEEYV